MFLGNIYQRLDVRVIAQREVHSILYQIVLPTTLLSCSSLSIFALDPVQNVQDRLNILYTIVLTIVANQFVTQDRLPILNYLTFIDWFLLATQLFVYLLIIESSIIATVATSLNKDVYTVDAYAMYALMTIYGLIITVNLFRAAILFQKRKWQAQRLDLLSRWCFYDEELRLARLYEIVGQKAEPTADQLHKPTTEKPFDEFLDTESAKETETARVRSLSTASRYTQVPSNRGEVAIRMGPHE